MLEPDHSPQQNSAPPAPLTSGTIAVGDGHALYVESVGTAGGTPAVYLHGGPGSGCQPDHRRLFDPRFEAVLFDQRGCGRSTPKGGREANTTAHLIADLELMRERFGFAKWLVVGGSWGATLALAYAQAHPHRVSGLVLRATFLGTPAELHHAFCVSLPAFYPQLHQDFLEVLPAGERDNPLPAYWRRILDPDPTIHAPYARAWHDTERILSELNPGKTRLDLAGLRRAGPLPSSPFMEAYYFSKDCFLAPDQLSRGIDSLAAIPAIIIQGRYDLLCPPHISHGLVARWPLAELRTIPAAGHSLYDPGVRDAVVTAVADLAARL
jgi:proline iminopeptidase